ncbi:MAG TPA: methylated-DNA--[protein]-cysteine S-methyltransferase [Planctomycetota bacterium]|nr:methylated-DNA--[protein]-cysteine S-methyltransferase [Planctomycetota bacterium]
MKKADIPLLSAVISSPLGPIQAVFFRRAVISLAFGEADDLPGADKATTQRLADDLASYFAGSPRVTRTPLDTGTGTPFQQRVWAELRRIPFGTTVSYGELARRVGASRAARAVGQAVGANPIPILIPCHRVICSNGSLGGFGAGPEIKKWLLRHEGCL